MALKGRAASAAAARVQSGCFETSTRDGLDRSSARVLLWEEEPLAGREVAFRSRLPRFVEFMLDFEGAGALALKSGLSWWEEAGAEEFKSRLKRGSSCRSSPC
eukprot:1190951-Prorocentrum_minimum.AAC.1